MTLCDAVWERLDRWEQLAAHGPPETLLPIARNELHRLVEGLRTLLGEHNPDDDGRCSACAGPLRNGPWPCQVWLTAHRQLIDGKTWAGAPAMDNQSESTVSTAPATGGIAPGEAPAGHVPSCDAATSEEADAPVWPQESADPIGTGCPESWELPNLSETTTSWDTISTAEIPTVSQHTPSTTGHLGIQRPRASQQPPWRQEPI